MTRKMLTATALVTALILGVFSFSAFGRSADAQGSAECSYALVVLGDVCADAVAYTGPFTNAPAIPGGAFGFGSLTPVAGAADGGTGGGDAAAATGGLAVTGSEATVLAYAGAGLIAFGAVALGSRRKFFQGALD